MIKLYVAGTKPVILSQLKFENAAEELQQSLETNTLPVHLIDIFTGQEVGTSCIKVFPYGEKFDEKRNKEYGYSDRVFPFLMQDVSAGEIIDLKTVNTDKIIDSYYSKIRNISSDTTNPNFDKLFEGWQLSDRMVYCEWENDSYPFCILNIDKGEIVISVHGERKFYEYCPLNHIYSVGEWGVIGKQLKWDTVWDNKIFIRGAINPAALAGIPIYKVYDIPSYITPNIVRKTKDAGVCLGGDRALLKLSNVTEFDFRASRNALATTGDPAVGSSDTTAGDPTEGCLVNTVAKTTSFFG